MLAFQTLTQIYFKYYSIAQSNKLFLHLVIKVSPLRY